MPTIVHDEKEYDFPLDAILGALTDDDIKNEADHRGLTPEPEVEYEVEYVDRIEDDVATKDLLVSVADFLRKNDKLAMAARVDDLIQELDI